MLFAYRGPIQRNIGLPRFLDERTGPHQAAAYDAPSDRPVARLRIDVHVVDGNLVYDAESEVHHAIGEGADREGALAALAEATRAVGSRVHDSAAWLGYQRQTEAVASRTPPVARPALPTTPTDTSLPQATGSSETDAAAKGASTLLSLVLTLGGASVFLGVLALAVTRWSSVGTGGQLALLVAFTLATFGGGVALGRRGFSRSGFTLELLGLELSWAIAHLAIDRDAVLPSTDAWVAAATLIAILHAAHAVRRPTAVVAASSCFALAVAAGLLALEHWASAPRGAALYAGAVAALFGGIAHAAARFGAPALGRPYAIASGVLALASAVGMTGLLAHEGIGAASSLEILWPYFVLGAAFAVARSREGAASGRGASLIGAVGVLLPSVQAVLLGIVGASFWVAGVTLAPLSFALALAYGWLDRRNSSVGFLASLAGSAWLLFSSGLALVSFVDTPSVATALWPFVLSVAGVGVGVLAAHLGGPSVASHARRAAVACVLVASSVELIAAPWGDTPLSLRWIASLAITHAIAILATRLFDTRGRGASLPFALSAALWSAGTTFWSLFTMHRDPSALLVAWPFIAAALAGGASRAIPSTEDERERSLEVSARSLLGSWGSVLLLLAPSAEVLVLDWRDAAFWVRGTVALAGTGLGALWVFRASLSPRQDRPDGAPKAPLTTPAIAFLLVAGAWALETTQAAFREVSLHGGVSFAAAWPYVISAAVFALGSVVGRSNPGVGLALQRSSAVVACASAGVMALVAPQHFGFLVLASALGGAVATAALRRDSEAAEPTSLGAVGVVGIACALGPPAFACLSRGLGAEGKGLLVAGAAGAPLLAYLAVFILANAMVIALAVSASHLAPSERRMLELGSVGTFFGVLGLLSLPHLERDYFFMSTLFVGGAVIIAFGLAKRRVLLVGATSVSLVLESFVQYFAKLHDALPWGLLALGFGLALLALALLFERKVRPHLPELARWA